MVVPNPVEKQRRQSSSVALRHIRRWVFVLAVERNLRDCHLALRQRDDAALLVGPRLAVLLYGNIDRNLLPQSVREAQELDLRHQRVGRASAAVAGLHCSNWEKAFQLQVSALTHVLLLPTPPSVPYS